MEKITTGGGTGEYTYTDTGGARPIPCSARAIRITGQYAFEPKEDITAYELAQCLPYTHGFGDMSHLPTDVMRHFKRIDP